MKKLSLFFALCIFVATMHGQTYWSLSGNSASSSDFIGTTNSQSLNFKTNNTTRMTLSQSKANWVSERPRLMQLYTYIPHTTLGKVM